MGGGVIAATFIIAGVTNERTRSKAIGDRWGKSILAISPRAQAAPRVSGAVCARRALNLLAAQVHEHPICIRAISRAWLLPRNLRQDGVYMTNDRIPYAKKSTLPRSSLSSLSLSLCPALAPSTLILFIPSGGGGDGSGARAPDTLITRLSLSLSLSLSRVSFSISFPGVISYPRRYYERASNGNRRMIHGDVKRDGSWCRLETSLPIHGRPREESCARARARAHLPRLKISKRRSIRRVDIAETLPEDRRRSITRFPITNGD